MKIDDWRRKIDAIDTAMLHLLNLRTELALEIGKMKSEEGVALRVPGREQEILARMKSLNPGPLVDEAVEKIYQLILDQSMRTQELHGCGNAASAKAERRRSRASVARRRAGSGRVRENWPNARVAFQGERGAFSEEAAIKLLGEDRAGAAADVRSGVHARFATARRTIFWRRSKTAWRVRCTGRSTCWWIAG